MPGKPKTREAHNRIRNAGGEAFVFERVANGHTLKLLAEELGVSRPVLSAWCNAAPRRDAYARARREAAHALAEQGLAIVDEATSETVGAAKLQSDYRKYLAARFDPQSWGDHKAMVNIDLGQLHLEALKSLAVSQRSRSRVIELEQSEEQNPVDTQTVISPTSNT